MELDVLGKVIVFYNWLLSYTQAATEKPPIPLTANPKSSK